MNKQLIFPMEEKYQEYLIDESKYEGTAESISFPENEAEVIEIVNQLKEQQILITVQGGKTGIVGAAVPQGGHVMNLSKMNHIVNHYLDQEGKAFISVEPGMNLLDLHVEIARAFRKSPQIWPPEPTETSATIGGIAASNALGINAFFYGDSKQYIQSVHMILFNGTKKIYSRDTNEMELDKVLGKEGLDGIFTELTLRLLPKPKSVWGISFFFESTEGVGKLIEMLRESFIEAKDANIVAMEYIDRNSIDLIEARKSTMTKLKEFPDIGPEFEGMVYIQIEGQEEGIEQIAEGLMEYAMESGSDPGCAWAISGETEVEKMKAFRHAAAETTNLFIEEMRLKEKRITKLGTDMSLANQNFITVLHMYQEGLREMGLHGCIFGHIGDNHLHVNILPKNYEEYERGVTLIRTWAEQTKLKGGQIICEHGIGKLKKKILEGILS